MSNPPGIAIEGDIEAGKQYIPQALQLLDNLKSYLSAGEIESGRSHLRLADDAYCYAIVAMGVSLVRIVVSPGVSSSVQFTATQFPDFLSGVVVKGLIIGDVTGQKRVLDSLFPTKECGRLHALRADTPNKIERLAVMPWAAFSELNGGTETSVFSQYTKLKPTMYTGRMRSVVQALMGFGKQERKSIYEEKERALGPGESTQKTPSQYERDVASAGLQIRYDYRFYRTHGIVGAADGVLWVVEVGLTRGVVAMPLPLHEETKADSFRALLEGMGDTGGLRLLDELGGFPTGESFAADTEEFDAWVRAGRYIKLKSSGEMHDFYRHSAYSSAMGWAFSSSGHEAHNTAYRYDDDGVQTGVHYSLSFHIGPSGSVAETAGSRFLKSSLRSFSKTHPKRFDAAMYKADRLSAEQIKAIREAIETGGAEAGWKMLDQLELAPLATAAAALALAGEGRIFWPTENSPQIKFPEPELGYLVSHDMRPYWRTDKRIKCDTTMHVFFVGEELKVCKFFHRPPDFSLPPKTTTDDEECHLAGSWETRTESGNWIVPSMFYTTDFDDREEIGEFLQIIRTKGTDLGYRTVRVGDDLSRPYIGYLSRSKTFRMETTNEIWEGRFIEAAVAVPFFDRSAYYYASLRGATTYRRFDETSYTNAEDPNGYITWRNLCGWTGFCPGQGCCERAGAGKQQWFLADHPAGCGKVTRRTVWEPTYDPYPCSDFADSGEWANVCADADSMVYAIPNPPSTNASQMKVGDRTLTVKLCSEAEQTPMTTKTIVSNDPGFSGGAWFQPSPSVTVAYIESTHNVLGDGNSLQYMQNINDPSRAVVGFPKYPEMENNTATFIGIVE